MKKEQLYEQPECYIVDFEAQSVLCASGVEPNFNPNFGDPFNDEQNW